MKDSITVSFSPFNTYISTTNTSVGYDYYVSDNSVDYNLHDLVYRYENDLCAKIGTVISEVNNVSFPKYNIYKEDNNVYIEVAIAGYNKDDIKIKVQNEFLFVAGVKPEESDKDYIIKNIAYRNWKLMFEIGDRFDTDNIEAKFDNGILTIALPLKDEHKEKVINIK